MESSLEVTYGGGTILEIFDYYICQIVSGGIHSSCTLYIWPFIKFQPTIFTGFRIYIIEKSIFRGFLIPILSDPSVILQLLNGWSVVRIDF